MARTWIHESPPRWDASKAAIVGGAPRGSLPPEYTSAARSVGEAVPGEWWRVEEDGRVVGYGWMDVTWNGGEILLAVHPEHARHGVGAYILDRLEAEARHRGLNYLYNVVQDSHPDRARVTRWLESHGFKGGEDGQLRRQVPKA